LGGASGAVKPGTEILDLADHVELFRRLVYLGTK